MQDEEGCQRTKEVRPLSLHAEAAEEEQEEKARERLEKARRNCRPRSKRAARQGHLQIGMRARLLYWRIAYGLTRLEIVGSGRNVSIRRRSTEFLTW